MYNSLPTGTTCRRVKQQVASIIHTNQSEVVLHHQPVQTKRGVNDCVLFALAFATSLCQGEDPTKITYVQHALRSHLTSCLEARRMNPFPKLVRSCRKINPIQEEEIVPVHCLCRLPESGKMVVCVGCRERYHQACVDVQKTLRKKTPWYCRKCA